MLVYAGTGVGGSAVARVEAWLRLMNRRYDLRRQVTCELNAAEPGRPPVFERFEVFEFGPM